MIQIAGYSVPCVKMHVDVDQSEQLVEHIRVNVLAGGKQIVADQTVRA